MDAAEFHLPHQPVPSGTDDMLQARVSEVEGLVVRSLWGKVVRVVAK